VEAILIYAYVFLSRLSMNAQPVSVKAASQVATAQRIALLGIGGAGMRALAQLLARGLGKEVIGADQRYRELRDASELSSYTLIAESEMVQQLDDYDLVIYSEGLLEDHPLRQLVASEKLPALTLYEALGGVATAYQTIAVAGTHGKSSTTAMLAHILVAAGLDPTVFVGASIPAWNNKNARIGTSDLFLAEADEYRNHFLSLTPRYLVVTSLDFDHPDWFADLEAVAACFDQLLSQMPADGIAVVPADLLQRWKHLSWPKKTIAVEWPEESLALALTGKHMQQNAWLAVAMAEVFGVAREQAIEQVASWQGLGRRMEKLGELAGVPVYSDYGHHPREIAVTLAGAVEHWPDKRILAVVEPHTEERLAEFFDRFVDVLRHDSAGVLLAPIYRARQDQPARLTSDDLAERLQTVRDDVWVTKSLAETTRRLSRIVTEFDMVVAFSAGDLDQALRQLLVGA